VAGTQQPLAGAIHTHRAWTTVWRVRDSEVTTALPMGAAAANGAQTLVELGSCASARCSRRPLYVITAGRGTGKAVAQVWALRERCQFWRHGRLSRQQQRRHRHHHQIQPQHQQLQSHLCSVALCKLLLQLQRQQQPLCQLQASARGGSRLRAWQSLAACVKPECSIAHNCVAPSTSRPPSLPALQRRGPAEAGPLRGPQVAAHH
jgi:hypothetical protein